MSENTELSQQDAATENMVETSAVWSRSHIFNGKQAPGIMVIGEGRRYVFSDN